MIFKKRTFDVVWLVLSLPLWAPVLTMCALVLLISNGWPVFYVSKRRVYRNRLIQIAKFRVMVRNADRIVNRTTLNYNGTRFLNLPIHSSVYTPVGRLVERCSLTELPQILHVLSGKMSLVGNRPLPTNVIEALREIYPETLLRFDSPCGLTGPVQLVGRHRLTDRERLALEIGYCQLVERRYSARFDFYILLTTVLICLGLRRRLTLEAVIRKMHSAAANGQRLDVAAYLPSEQLGRNPIDPA